jgi:ketosteroid isomerase-like protein
MADSSADVVRGRQRLLPRLHRADGKVVAFKEFTDTARLAEAFAG